jgi:two-component system cell cycle sensor histidine kinase/response regulator CckA
VTTLDEALEQNRVLRERLERLERAQPGVVDPLLQTIVAHAPAFMAAITPDGRLVATGRTSAAFGSVIGRSVFEFTEPAEHALMRRAYARVCETKQPLIYESTGQGENGEPNHTYVVRAVPVIEDDTVKTIVLIPTDITDRVRLERSLEHSEAKLRFAVAATRMGLWSWDIERDEVTWDERVLEIFGVSEPPADQLQYLALIHPDDRSLVRSALEQAIRTGVYAPFEHRLAQPMNGVERWVLGTGTVLKNSDGQATGLMGGALDITAQKGVAAQLQRAQRVEALGQLTAGLAHNFNNLLGAIIPNIELGLQHAASLDPAPLAAALDASLQARDLVKKLTSLTRQRPTATARWSDPREVLERAVAICRATFPREIQLTLGLPPEPRCVGIDASDLDQVVLNLLFNARDALEPPTGRSRLIEIVLDDVSEPGHERQVRLRVRDNGAGMSEDVRARIFEPFFTTKPAHRGSGLGLADAVLRLQDAAGKLECHSVAGQGTTFTVLLPEAPAPTGKPAPGAAAPLASNGETILIVDDEAGVRTAIGRLLTQKGYEVLEAESAEHARATLSARGAAVSLILLDQSMPNESGPEALPSLKRLTDAPIVLFTGGVGEVPPGIAGLLEKPALAADLLKMVHDLIQRSTSSPR